MIEDQIKQIIAQRDESIRMLAEWVVAVNKDSSWDGWDYYYKNAAYSHCLIRDLLDRNIKELMDNLNA